VSNEYQEEVSAEDYWHVVEVKNDPRVNAPRCFHRVNMEGVTVADGVLSFSVKERVFNPWPEAIAELKALMDSWRAKGWTAEADEVERPMCGDDDCGCCHDRSIYDEMGYGGEVVVSLSFPLSDCKFLQHKSGDTQWWRIFCAQDWGRPQPSTSAIFNVGPFGPYVVDENVPANEIRARAIGFPAPIVGQDGWSITGVGDFYTNGNRMDAHHSVCPDCQEDVHDHCTYCGQCGDGDHSECEQAYNATNAGTMAAGLPTPSAPTVASIVKEAHDTLTRQMFRSLVHTPNPSMMFFGEGLAGAIALQDELNARGLLSQPDDEPWTCDNHLDPVTNEGASEKCEAGCGRSRP
jgi:hypothetical protein